VTPPPTAQVVTIVAPRPALVRSSVFPTTLVTADLLDDFAEQETKKDAALQARKDALKKAQEEQEAKAEAELLKAQKAAAEREAKKAAALQAQKEAKEAAVAAAAEKVKKSATATAAKSPAAAKANKFGAVQTINKQAERIAEREANGGERPSLFGN